MQLRILTCLLFGSLSWANIQYSGNAFTATVTGTGTKQTLIDDIETALKNGSAGWTTVSGSGTTNLLMASGTTAQSLQIRARFKDNSGTGIQVYVENTAGTLTPASYTTSNGGNLLATNGLVYTVVASKFQFMIFSANATTPRQFVWVGMPYLTTALASNISTAGWLACDSDSDSDTTVRGHLRNFPVIASGQSNGAPNYELMVHTSWWENSNNNGISTANRAGAPRLILGGLNPDFTMQISTPTAYRWDTATPSVVTGDILIAWGLTGATDESLVRGQLFDCVYIADSQPIATPSTFDGHNWYNITNSNAGSLQNYPRGGIWCATN